jgi:hypothetical protein
MQADGRLSTTANHTAAAAAAAIPPRPSQPLPTTAAAAQTEQVGGHIGLWQVCGSGICGYCGASSVMCAPRMYCAGSQKREDHDNAALSAQ